MKPIQSCNPSKCHTNIIVQTLQNKLCPPLHLIQPLVIVVYYVGPVELS